MTHFEPESTQLGEYDEKTMRLEHDYTDEDLLIELRRRGRLARVECENIVPDRYVTDGLAIEYQIKNAWRDIAQEAARLHVQGRAPTGAKVENVQGNGLSMPPSEKGRRIRFAVNYVVDKL